MNDSSWKNVGHSVPKVDGVALVTGKAKFVMDYLPIDDLHYLKVLRSPYPHAIIKEIDFSEALKLDGVVAVFSWRDVPRKSYPTAGQGYPEPSPYDTFLLDKKVRFVGDNVCAVVANSIEIAEKALKLIRVEYELLPPIFDPRIALKEGASVIHDESEAKMIIPAYYDPKRNISAKIEVEVGDIDNGIKEADVIIEEQYEVHYAQHVPMETHVTLTYFDENGRLVIVTSTQVPFHVRRIVSYVLDFPEYKIRVVKPRIGGGFGAKQEVLLEPLCAFASIKTGKPILYQFSREEEFIASRTRHPQIINLKTGIKKDGTLTFIDLDIIMNSGAYGTHSLTVLSNSGSKTLPLYKCNNVRFRGVSVYTNLPTGGAFRGYGATQAYFAIESQIDELSYKIGMDPLELRKKLHIRSGDSSPIFAALGEGKPGVEQTIGSCGLDECIDRGAQAIGWKEKRETYGKDKGRYRRGVGMAIMMQGSSIPYVDMGSAIVKINEDGSVILLVGATDLGTGSDTILAQIVGEVLSIDYRRIVVYSSDTDFTPFDTGAYASSTTYLSGEAVRKAALELKADLLKVASKMLEEEIEELDLWDGFVVAKRDNKKKVALGEVVRYAVYEKEQHEIIGSASHYTKKSPPPFAAHFGEIEVDTRTGKINIIKYVAAVDCGMPINPKLVEGQIEGAVVQGIGYALTERFIFDEYGRVTNPTLRYYKIPNIKDIPEIVTIIVPTYEESGPFGAKSVSEISINGPLPVIANAFRHATGIRVTRTPFTPQYLLGLLKK